MGESESLTRQQQVDAMNARVSQIRDRLGAIKAALYANADQPHLQAEQAALRSEHRAICVAINECRGGRNGEIPPWLLVAQMQKLVDPGMMKSIVAEARERLLAGYQTRAAAPPPATPEVERKQALLAQRKALSDQIDAMAEQQRMHYIADFAAFLDRKKSLGRQLCAINMQLNKLRVIALPTEAAPRSRTLDEYIGDVGKERVTQATWKIIIAGALSVMKEMDLGQTLP